jgi:hypothetical protein
MAIALWSLTARDLSGKPIFQFPIMLTNGGGGSELQRKGRRRFA